MSQQAWILVFKHFISPPFFNKPNKSVYASSILTEQTKIYRGNQDWNLFYFFPLHFLMPVI